VHFPADDVVLARVEVAHFKHGQLQVLYVVSALLAKQRFEFLAAAVAGLGVRLPPLPDSSVSGGQDTSVITRHKARGWTRSCTR